MVSGFRRQIRSTKRSYGQISGRFPRKPRQDRNQLHENETGHRCVFVYVYCSEFYQNDRLSGAAKPSNLRAKFENLAKTSTEDDQKRTAEQKRIREEKDRLDREQAAKKSVKNIRKPLAGCHKNLEFFRFQTFESTQEESKPTQRRVNIDTGRSGGISGAISAFNQVQSPASETPTQRVKFTSTDATHRFYPKFLSFC